MQPSRKLFRKVALERLSSPDQIDRLARVTSPRAWLALLGLGLMLVTAILWSVTGSIPITQPAQGIFLRGDGVQLVRASRAAQITRLNVAVGDVIAANQNIATLIDVNTNQPFAVTSLQAGRVLEIRVSQGDILAAGQPIVSLEPILGDLEVVLYVPAAVGKSLQPGIPVQVSPASVQREVYGFLVGKVKSVGTFPATQQGMLRVLGSDELVKQFSQNGSPLEVRVELEKAETPSGLRWSSPQGPAFPIQSGTFCTATVVLGEQRPINMVLGIPSK